MAGRTSKRFVDTEETFHFFNDAVVLGTNEVRNGEDDGALSSSSSSDSSERSRRKRAKRRRRAKSTSSALSVSAARRRSRLRSGSGRGDVEMEENEDGFSGDDEEDDYEIMDGFELEEEEEDNKASQRSARDDRGEGEGQAAAMSAKLSGVGTARFEQIFEPFRDLYIPSPSSEPEDSRDILTRPMEHTGRQQQFRKARRAIASLTRRVHCGNSYRYRKQSEFMHVCYLRAIEGEPEYELSEETAEEKRPEDGNGSTVNAGETKAGTKMPLLAVSRKEDAVETTVPTLFPRKWPNLPYRHPLEWHDNVEAIVEFLTRLAELPETSLIYEPIDVQEFKVEATKLLELSGAGNGVESSSRFSESALAGLLGLLGMGVQLQSFSLLSGVALQLISLGQTTCLGKKEGEREQQLQPQLRNLLELYYTRLAKHAAEPPVAATFSRDLSAQWKVCSYQPSTSDAIATDGLYLYIFGRSGLLKIGTGNGTTVRDYVYAHNKKYARGRDAERSWLCCIGDSLYCRTIVMPGHRVDRIRTSDLDTVQELFLAPNRGLIGKGITESSVYAMVTDGVDLYTIRCIDTFKRPLHGKSSTSRKHRSRTHKSRKSTPVSEIVSVVVGKTSEDPLLQSQSPDDTVIQMGDRVVRGPDWKWSNQDGEKGSPGTVERISTWGGVKGSGVTVRWDKNQRVNTYRWGAEGCYDLYVIVEKDGQILERKPLPANYRARKTTDAEGAGGGEGGDESGALLRHQFVLYRHKVKDITSIMKLKEHDIDLFLDLTPSGDPSKERSEGAGPEGRGDAESKEATLSALHSHPVALCTSKTSWMCDGGMSNCFGDNAAKRYRCTSGCDYDLCEWCLLATVMGKAPGEKTPEEDGAEGDTAAVIIAVTDDKTPGEKISEEEDAGAEGDTAAAVIVPTDDKAAGDKTPEEEGDGAECDTATADDKAAGGDRGDAAADEGEVKDAAPKGPTEAVTSPSATSGEGLSTENANPFSTFDASLFYDGEGDAATKKKEGEAKEKQEQQTEEQLVDNLAGFWCGVYTRKECQVALRRNGLQLNEASSWLHRCGAYLREPMIIPTVASVVLTTKSKSGALDPVLLIAGTFYASQGQLCVVSPPGLYAVGEGQSEKAKRAANSCDASWFFSLETGILLADKPVLLKGIPAGSPTCVDVLRKRILVFSGYLNCLEEYADQVQQADHSIPSLEMPSDTTTLSDMGEMILAQLARLMRRRAALPAYKHPRAGLQDILFRIGREPATTAGDKPATLPGAGEDMTGVPGPKSKSRRIKNIRARLKEMERLQIVDRPGHFIPFCVDFEDDGLVLLFQALMQYCRQFSPKRRSGGADEDSKRELTSVSVTNFRVVADILRLLTETVQEFEFVGVTIRLATSDQATQQLFRDTEAVLVDIARDAFDENLSQRNATNGVVQRERSEMVLSAHFLLVWGIRKGIFCSDCRSQFFVSTCEKILHPAQNDGARTLSAANMLSDSYFAVMLEPRDSLVLRTKSDCDVDLLRGLLYSPMDTGRIAIGDFLPTQELEFSRFLEALFALSKLESCSRAKQKWVAGTGGLPFQSPVSKALHSVMNYCSTRMYNESTQSSEKGEQDTIGTFGMFGTISAFEHFARACFDCSLELLRRYQDSAAPVSEQLTSDEDLRSSVAGTILPLVIAAIPNFSDQLSQEFRIRLFVLMKSLDKFISSKRDNWTTAALSPSTPFFEGHQVVESPHPYNQAQPAFRRVVRIPGASVLHFEFDPQCRTSGEADFVFITPGLAWFQADRIPYGDVGLGEDGGCFFGSYSRGNWPAGGLTIVGDTATIMLCATTQGRSGTEREDRRRWGIKCTVRGLFGSPKKSWIADLGSAVANACSVIGDKLLRGLPQQRIEKACQPWVVQRSLFDLAPLNCDVLSPSKWELVNDIAKHASRGAAFFSTLEKYVRLRKLPARQAHAGWIESLQEAAAVLLVRSDPHLLASWLAASDNDGTELPEEEERSLFQRIAVELGKLERWMLRQVQLVNEWHYLWMDEVSLDELMERYADNLDRLSELCQLKDLPFKAGDMIGCIKSIHKLLTEEIAAKSQSGKEEATDSQQPSESHQAVAEAVSTKARFLLARWQKCSDCDGSRSSSTSDLGQPRTTSQLSKVGEFLRGTIAISTLEECAEIHSRRVVSRVAGVAYCKEAFEALESSEMAKFFVGRVLHAIPSNSIVQDDGVFAGCALADPHLLAEMTTSLHSYAEVMGTVSARESEQSATRAVALADFCNFAYSVESTSSRIIGLERATKLVLTLDDEMNSSDGESVLAATAGGEKVGWPMHASGIAGQAYDSAWIMLRLLTEEVYDDAHVAEVQADLSRKQSIGRVFKELRVLYKHFAAKNGVQESSASVAISEGIRRLVCAVVGKVRVLHEWPEAFGWWVQNAVDLVTNPGAALFLNLAGARLLRNMFEMLGDAIFELEVNFENSISTGKHRHNNRRVVLGRDIQRILLKRIGSIVSPLASPVDVVEKGQDTSADHCVVIFRSDEADDKLIDAVNSIGEPDISSLEILAEVSDDKDAVERATTKAIAECAVAEVTMKHSSVRCDGCNQSPLRGFRFKCFSCSNYDLCTTCYMNQTHNTDHAFVRLTDAAGAGDLLQPRSKGGGVVPETALIGSKQWKASLLRVQLMSQGYVVYRSGSRHDCCETAQALAQLGFLVTVAEKRDMTDVDSLHDWESKMQLTFEPGSGRLSHRRSTTSTQKGASKKSDRDVINAFNTKASTVNSEARFSSRQVQDRRVLASELIAVLRLLLSSRPAMEKWRSSSLKSFTDILEVAPDLLSSEITVNSAQHEAYFVTLGATQVLGGFRETLRVGGTVVTTNCTAGKVRGGKTGVIYSYSFGSDDVVVTGLTDGLASAWTGAGADDNEIALNKIAVSEATAVSEIPLDSNAVQSLEPLAPSFCSVAEKIYAWTTTGRDQGLAEDEATSAVSLLRWELGCALMQAFSSMIPAWPSLFDNQVISTSGNSPAILFQLAQMCVRDVKVEDIEDARALLWQMEWLRSRQLHFSLATRPISASSFGTSDEKACVLRPPPSSGEEASPLLQSFGDGASSPWPVPSDFFFNLYAFSSCADLPQHSGRNKMLEYWEKNVIPAIETYVSGSFKSYEMDYFFAQLREPLREGNSAAALKIAYTLCDGHVPSGCHYPDQDTDWSALQIDDVEVGARYLIASENVVVGGWPEDMLWTLGHSGAVRVVSPSSMVLLQVLNPMTSTAEYWWYHVDNLRSLPSVSSITEQTVTDFEDSRARLQTMTQQLIYCIARKSVFELLQVAPEHAMKLSIETKKTSLSRTSSSPFPLPSSSPSAFALASPAQLTAPLPKDLGNRYNLADLLRLAAAADLGCPEKALCPDMAVNGDGTAAEAGFGLFLRPKASAKTSLIAVLQSVLNKHFERAAASPPIPVMDRSTSYDENASVMVTTPAKKHKKRGKQGTLAGKLAAAAAGSPSLSASSSSSSSLSSSSGSATMLRPTQPKLQQPEVDPAFSTRKYRYLLMEALLEELKSSLDLSSAFLRSRSFMVTSDSPPQPLALVHVPDATCLVLSFAVHPVLMDLPAGSSLEFFRDERCTDRLFGYFGEKRGLNYLPPLVVPGDRCYVRMSQGTYARYKFRVDALTADFGLALWICEEIYQKLLTVQLSNYEVETVLTTLLNALVEYLIATSACLPSSAKNAVYKIAAKLINFALSKGAVHAVPIAKLSGLVRELTFVYDNERTTQKGLHSLFTQQLAELISLVEEVSSLKGGSSPILGGAWWTDFVRMAAFTRVLGQGKREIATPDAFKRIYCGRAPVREIEAAHEALATRDLFSERLLFLQNLPKTSRVAELEASVSRFLVHLSLEECGEADDQNVYSAAVVTRFGIISSVLYLPVDEEGQTKGYGIVDIGRADIISNLLTRIPKETFEFDGGVATQEDTELLAKIEAVCRPPDSASSKPAGDSGSGDGDSGGLNNDVWSCGVCTLENAISEVECAACGSPIPPELAELARDAQVQAQPAAETTAANDTEDTSASGWACPACTFVNNWAESNCEACAMERSPDLIPPSVVSAGNGDEAEAGTQENGGDDATPSAASDAASTSYRLNAARFVEILRVADGTDEIPEQLTGFLRHRLFQTVSSPSSETKEDSMTDMAEELRGVLKQETAQYSSSPDSKAAVEAFAALVGVKKTRSWEGLSGVQRLSELTSAQALSTLVTQPLNVAKWMRSSGYDLQFELNHYESVEDAMQAQVKWTHPMDCQLIAACRELSGNIGVLTLGELCPSHLSAEKHAREYPLLVSLETRDLRLRFAVLQSLNKLLLAALPLVNLRPWSDPNSLRSRIISIRQLIFPGVKIRFFAQTQDNTTLAHSIFADTNAKRPMVTIDRRKIAGKRGGGSSDSSASDASTSASVLRDPKRSLFASTMKQLSVISPSLLRAKRPTGASDPFVSFIVIFAGENVVGEGGPYRQLFNDISNELLSTNGNPLFIPTQNNVMKAGDFRERYLPKPSSTSKELLHMFEFVGLLMGCCLRTGVRLNLRLAPLVWKMLVKQSLVFADLESVDHSLCESLKFLEALAAIPSEDPSEILYESFTTTLSDGTIVELKTGGHATPVTKANVKEYIRLVKATRLQECKPQVDAMLRGLGKIVPVQLLQLCVWSELQQWVGGSLEINLELLKRHTRYSSGMTPEQFPHLEIFWKVLAGFSEENKRRFINFAWGQDTLPADDAEFDRTHTRLLIKTPPQDTGVDHDALLPKADTCFFNIELPAYSSEAVMRQKLLLAITLCTSLDGDDQTAGRMDIYYAGDEVDDDAME